MFSECCWLDADQGGRKEKWEFSTGFAGLSDQRTGVGEPILASKFIDVILSSEPKSWAVSQLALFSEAAALQPSTRTLHASGRCWDYHARSGW